MAWCEHCRDHFDEDHYGEDGFHRTGNNYGPTGTSLARMELLEDLIGEVVDADTDGAASLPQELRERLVNAYNDSERVPKASG